MEKSLCTILIGLNIFRNPYIKSKFLEKKKHINLPVVVVFTVVVMIVGVVPEGERNMSISVYIFFPF